MHVFNVAIGQPEIIDGINGVLMPCVDQVLVKFSKMWQNTNTGPGEISQKKIDGSLRAASDIQ